MKISVKRLEVFGHENSKLKAFASVAVEGDGIKIILPDLHLFFGDKGPFVDPPASKAKKGDKWFPHYYIDKDTKKKILMAVLDAYRKKCPSEE